MYFVKVDENGNTIDRASGFNPFGIDGIEVSEDIFINAQNYKYIDGEFVYIEPPLEIIEDRPTQEEIEFAEFILDIDSRLTALEGV